MSKKIMLRFGWCALLFAIVLVGDRGFASFLDRLFFSSKFRFSLAYTGQLETDLLILGNSRGANSFHQPTLEEGLGLRAANLSFNGLPAAMMPVLFEDYLAHQPPPKLLVIEVTCVGGRRAAGTIERFSVLSSRSQGVRDLLKDQNFKFYASSEVFHLLRYNSELMWRSLAFLRKSDQSWAMVGQIGDELVESVDAESSFKMLDRSTEDMEALKRVIEIADSRSIRVELVVAPYLKQYRERLDDFDGWFAWLESSLGRSITDYSLALDDSAMFADRLHLNVNGNKAFSAIIVDRLRNSK